MVSNAREDLPEPDSPVNTISASRGISRSTFLRLCSRAPRTWMVLWGSPAGRRLRLTLLMRRGLAQFELDRQSAPNLCAHLGIYGGRATLLTGHVRAADEQPARAPHHGLPEPRARWRAGDGEGRGGHEAC